MESSLESPSAKPVAPVPHSATGTHLLAELNGCPQENLNDPAAIEVKLVEAAKAAGATVVSSHFHHFSPQGVSGVIIIAESHITLHTWPELGYAALDVFTCGHPELPGKVTEQVRVALGALYTKTKTVTRGPAI